MCTQFELFWHKSYVSYHMDLSLPHIHVIWDWVCVLSHGPLTSSHSCDMRLSMCPITWTSHFLTFMWYETEYVSYHMALSLPHIHVIWDWVCVISHGTLTPSHSCDMRLSMCPITWHSHSLTFMWYETEYVSYHMALSLPHIHVIWVHASHSSCDCFPWATLHYDTPSPRDPSVTPP